MEMTVVGAVLVVCMLLMLTSGIWVALTLTGLAIIGLALIENSSIGLLLGTSSWSATTGWSLTALPLFIWMGEILFRTRLSRDLFEGLRTLVERDFLVERGGEGAGRQYGFAMDLVRVWIEQNDEYSRLLEELRA